MRAGERLFCSFRHPRYAYALGERNDAVDVPGRPEVGGAAYPDKNADVRVNATLWAADLKRVVRDVWGARARLG